MAMRFRILSDRVTSYAQIVLSVVFIVGYFLVLKDFIHGNIKVSPEWKETLQVLLGVLTANIGVIISYWFSRQRASEPRNDTP